MEPDTFKNLPAPLQPFALSLDNSGLDNDGLKELARFRHIRFLSVGNTAVTDDGLKSLADLMDLQHLNLANVRVTDAGLKHLTKLKHLRTLTRLWRTSVTDDGFEAPRRGSP